MSLALLMTEAHAEAHDFHRSKDTRIQDMNNESLLHEIFHFTHPPNHL